MLRDAELLGTLFFELLLMLRDAELMSNRSPGIEPKADTCSPSSSLFTTVAGVLRSESSSKVGFTEVFRNTISVRPSAFNVATTFAYTLKSY